MLCIAIFDVLEGNNINKSSTFISKNLAWIPNALDFVLGTVVFSLSLIIIYASKMKKCEIRGQFLNKNTSFNRYSIYNTAVRIKSCISMFQSYDNEYVAQWSYKIMNNIIKNDCCIYILWNVLVGARKCTITIANSTCYFIAARERAYSEWMNGCLFKVSKQVTDYNYRNLINTSWYLLYSA